MSINFEYKQPLSWYDMMHETAHAENRRKIETLKHENLKREINYLKDINEKLLRAVEAILQKME